MKRSTIEPFEYHCYGLNALKNITNSRNKKKNINTTNNTIIFTLFL